MLRKRKFAKLEKSLGHRFRNQDLLAHALTHSSANNGKPGSQDNERLEFIGDRVLGLVIAEYLGESFPNDDEGRLARRFNALVRREACAHVGESIDLGASLILSDAEEGSGGREKATLIADAMEAVLAAVFFDAGYTKARAVVRTLWAELSDTGQETSHVDAKSALQEWAQGRGLPLPVYKVVSREGPDHAPRFTTSVELPGERTARGIGTSKRAAEQSAAQALLTSEGVWDNEGDDASSGLQA